MSSLTQLPYSIERYRDIAIEWCEFAVGIGRAASDPVYRWVTEHRDPGPGYSSCADLAHWMLYRLGVRLDCINREEHQGWRSIVNVSRLCRPPVGSNKLAEAVYAWSSERPIQDPYPERGDVLVLWARKDTTDAHVCVMGDRLGASWKTWDYGQAPMSAAKWRPGSIETAHKRRRQGLIRTNDGMQMVLDRKPIQSVLRLERVLQTALEQGCLVEPDLASGERLEQLQSELW